MNVLHPMGWDAFGLPAENYAIKTGIHPKESTGKNIATFKRQIQSLGFSYDWFREINTSDPAYMKWTQWFFLLLYQRGLAYRKKAAVNWCESCQTVLANEQVVDGLCERSKDPVTQKELKQWFFRVTAYAEELLSSLDELDYPERLKALQRNWIGKSEGVEIDFSIIDSSESLTDFTTRPDTLYGVTYLVVAPEHSRVHDLTTDKQRGDVEAYVTGVREESLKERRSPERKKTGVFTGSYAVNPVSNEKIPIWIGDYVLMEYGTGTIMAVPAHDNRDFEFAEEHHLEKKCVIDPDALVITGEPLQNRFHKERQKILRAEVLYDGSGTIMNSPLFNDLNSRVDFQRILDIIERQKIGKCVTTYRIRDWLVSRQRYWGAPIPIVYCAKCGEQPVPQDQLPILLPDDVADFRPKGKSPLATSPSFLQTSCPKCGGVATRETDTMDGFVDNSWYFFRYLSPQDAVQAFDPKEAERWMPIDLYVGGIEHAVGHLIYSRFFTKVLRDAGKIAFGEPYKKVRNQGLILAEDGRKMSKSLGNVINPDDVVLEYGADTLRLYEMFLGPFDTTKPWDTKGIMGVRRFLEKVWYMTQEIVKEPSGGAPSEASTLLQHQTIQKVTQDIDALHFNTAISAMMIYANHLQKASQGRRALLESLLLCLAPFAPHLAEESWELLGHSTSIFEEPWPKADPAQLVFETVSWVIQVNGRVRATVVAAPDCVKEEILASARSDEKIQRYLEGKTIVKEILSREDCELCH